MPVFGFPIKLLSQLYILGITGDCDLNSSYRIVGVDDSEVIHAWPGAVIVLLYPSVQQSLLDTGLCPEFFIAELRHGSIMTRSGPRACVHASR